MYNTYILPISEKVGNKIKEFKNKNYHKDYVFFKIEDINFENTMFLLAHGSSDGRIFMGDNLITNKQLLIKCAEKMKKKHIEKIITICCHGGMQKDCYYEGLYCQSFHNQLTEIKVNVFQLIDSDDCELVIEI